jgi:hypothetical protein
MLALALSLMGSVGGDRRETLSTIPSSAASLIGEALNLFGLAAICLPGDLLGPLGYVLKAYFRPWLFVKPLKIDCRDLVRSREITAAF